MKSKVIQVPASIIKTFCFGYLITAPKTKAILSTPNVFGVLYKFLKGVFIVDSPIDLLGLYENSVENIQKNYSEVAVEESKWIVSNFDKEFGIGDSSVSNYEAKSPYVSKTHSLTNLSAMKNIKIRLYSEPDTLWCKENRQTEYEGTNAYYIEQLATDLNQKYGKNTAEYITTKNKGYRANGERHPHSWSIVDKENLINWILKK